MTNQDRNYLSMLSDAELVRTALDRNHELAVVLAERLSELLDVEDELVELQILYDRLVAENNAQRMSGTANTAGGLYGVLDALSNETAIPTEVKLDPVALAGKSQTEVADIIADALRPIDGTQDSDAARDSIARALSEVLAADPNADLTNLDAVQIEQVVEAYLGHDLAHRIELDVGKAVLDKAASYSVGVDRLEEMKAYVRQAVAQAIRARSDIGQRLNQSTTASLANEILRDTFEIFESYL